MAKKRNYDNEYAKYQGTPAQIKKRASRNKARRAMEKAGKVRKGDGLDVNHKDGNALNDKLENYQVQTKKANRSFPRTKRARKKFKDD